MRTPVLALTVLLGLLLAMPCAAGATAAAAPMAAASVMGDEAQQPAPPQIDVDIDREGGAWYTSPMWIAIGVIALVVLIMLIVMATRGGGTTIVRD